MATTTATTTTTGGGINRLVAMIVGAVLVLVGLLGFVMDPVLGIFEVNAVHNIVHLLSGAVLLAGAFIDNGRNARMTLLILGVVYAVLTVFGFVAQGVMNALLLGTDTNPATNMAENVLHLLLAIVFIAVPLIVKDDVRRPAGNMNRL